ncbi:EAL domain-containing protein [Pseudomonas sp. NPDC087697]|uniref:EAL domain-containing response regulator n=1 Tax=Pseudomonas sp. NPDC087697 TaxID=3364447 RepID=UPI0038077BD6
MSYRVLIVEDHPFQHEYLLNLFNEQADVCVESAKDGSEALECVKKQRFDLVLTDLMMPGMDGVQFIQKLAKLPHKPALAIMSTASRRIIGSASLAAKSMGLSVIGQLSKPVVALGVSKLIERLDTLHAGAKPTARYNVVPDRKMLERALSQGELVAWFQPKKSLVDGRIVAAEALARWVHPEHGVLMPATFLPAMIKFGLLEELLWLFIEQTITAQENWKKQRFDIPVSINLPTCMLDSDDLADRLHAFVLARGGNPARLSFELMESSTTRDISRYYAGACRIRMKGFGLAQDDFGQGYSSYFNLVSTPFTELKIDRALVHGCVENESLAAALGSIIALGRKLGLDVVAEGVETQEELALLRDLQCERVQGFLISPAVSVSHFYDLLNADEPGMH